MESEVTEEEQEDDNPTRFNTKQLAEGFSIIEKTLACFESQDPKLEMFTKVVAAVCELWNITSSCRKRRKNLIKFLESAEETRAPKATSICICGTHRTSIIYRSLYNF